MEFTANQYIDDVMNNRLVVCRYVFLAVERHVKDLERQRTEEFPYYYDEEEARFVIDFFSFLKHSKGEWAGKPVELEPWQQFVLGCIFGWKKVKDDTRRFQIAYEEIARKNGKSTKLAGVGNFGLVADGEAGAEIYSAAVDKEQAKIIWQESKNMVDASDDLADICQTYKSSITVEDTNSKYVPLSSETKTKDGLHVHLGLIDEYHAHPNDEMYNLVRSGMAARSQPLLYIITTAGFNKSGSCKREHDYGVQILEGTRTNEEYFVIIFTLDKDDDWTDPKNWPKANPNLGVSIKIEQMMTQFNEVAGRPSKVNEFKTKRLNIWTSSYTRWIVEQKWKPNTESFNESELEGKKCFIGVDLSTTTDIAGYALCFPPEREGERYKFIYRFYLPEDGLRDRTLREDVPYEAWRDSGHIKLTLGNVIDYNAIESDIIEDSEKYEVSELLYDPLNATHLINNLVDEEINCIEFKQGIMNVSPAVKDYERGALKGEMATNNNPVYNYMIGCAEVYSDSNGNQKVIKPDRRSSTKRIDGVIMSFMSYYRAKLDLSENKSVYEKRGVRSI